MNFLHSPYFLISKHKKTKRIVENTEKERAVFSVFVRPANADARRIAPVRTAANIRIASKTLFQNGISTFSPFRHTPSFDKIRENPNLAYALEYALGQILSERKTRIEKEVYDFHRRYRLARDRFRDSAKSNPTGRKPVMKSKRRPTRK